MIWLNKNKFFSRYLPMILSVILVMVAIGSYFIYRQAQVAKSAWYSSANGTWNYREKITIDHTKVNTGTGTTTPLTNFPVLISTTSVLLKSVSNGGHVASSTGGDIIFTAADGLTKLSHELECYSSSTGAVVSWVKIPSLSSVANTVIYIYYGNAADTANEQNVSGVWDTNYKGVWHLPNGVSLGLNDSTSNGYNLANSNSATAAAGQIGGGVSLLSASSQYLSRASVLSMMSTAITLEVWVKASSFPGAYNTAISINDGGSNDFVDLHVKSNGTLAMYTHSSADIFYDGTGTNTLSAGTWYHLVMTYDSTKGLVGYVNGTVDGTATANGNINIAGNPTFNIGNNAVANPTRFFNGIEDEARVSNVARSSDWIKTEYNNQSSPSTFASFGAEETQPTAQVNGGWYNASWLYRKKIVINHQQVSGTSTLTNFPVLVSTTQQILSYTSFGGHVASSTGGDILFTDQNGILLNFEREKYASSTGELEAWVQIPSLSPTVDTDIYMYYGNASATDQQNKTAVWDSNYKGVWHLGDAANSTIMDSTSNTNNGTNVSNNLTSTVGQIDGAGKFNGTNTSINEGTGLNVTSYTLSAWSSPSTSMASIKALISKSYIYELDRDTSSNRILCATGNGSSWSSSYAYSPTYTPGTWNYFVCTFNGSTSTGYSNGVAGTSITPNNTPVASGNGVKIGESAVAAGYNWDGPSDEVRISNIARSTDWIITEYNNQSAPSAFESIAGEETQSATSFNSTWYSGAWVYRKPIVIDHRKVNLATGTTTPLTNFPVLINVTDNDLKNYVASSSGADILFTASDGVTKLNYERESFSTSTGQLIAWVQAPLLTNITDTTLFMYFGNSTSGLADQQNKTAVWNSNYKAVWHENYASAVGAQADSTSNGVPLNNVYGLSLAPGQIGNSLAIRNNDSYPTRYSPGNPNITISCWFKTDGVTQSSGYYWICGLSNNGSSAFAFKYISGSNLIALSRSTGTSSTDQRTIPYTADSQWHYIVGTLTSGSNLDSAVIYLDGVAQTTSGGTGISVNISGALFGSGQWGGDGYATPNGATYSDELHWLNAVESADLIKTEYLNQSQPSTFSSLGALQLQNRPANQAGISAANRSWYNKNWQYRIPITISHNMVGSSTTLTLSNFPVLASATNSSLKTVSNGGGVASAVGNDILFTDSDGGTKLAHEIETYSSTTGQLVAWVKVPSLSTQQDHVIYLYYGNNTSNLPSQSNPSNVWDSNYKAVYHLGQPAVSNGSTVYDSTANANNGIVQTVANPFTSVAGIIANAMLSNNSATNNEVLTPHVDFGNGKAFSFSVWAQGFTPSLGGAYSLMGGDVNNYSNFYIINLGGSTTNNAIVIRDSALHYVSIALGTFSLNTWYLISVDVDSSGNATFYKNGASLGSGSGITATTSIWELFNGYYPYYSALDEARLTSNRNRGVDWWLTEYLNQSQPSAYITYGSQQTSGTATAINSWYNNSWTNRRMVTIDRRKVSTVNGTTLTNFPVLISATDPEFKTTGNGGKVASSTGADILFTDSDGLTKLDYERESYSSSTGQLIAWVQVPTLSPTADHVLYMYYGNNTGGLSDQQNVAGTWDSNFKGVWHFPNGSSLSLADSVGVSTPTNNSVTAGTGIADGGAVFNSASSAYVDLGSSLNSLITSGLTVSAWINIPSGGPNFQDIMANIDNSYNGFEFGLLNFGGKLKIQASLANSGTKRSNTATTILSYGSWNYVALTYDNINTSTVYENDSIAPQTGVGANSVAASSLTTQIGGVPSGFDPLNGNLDELRISNIARSPDWMETEYLNELRPGTFYSIGPASNIAKRPASTPALKARGTGVRYR